MKYATYAARDPLLVSDGAVGAKTIGRIAGKDVPATGAAVCEQPRPVDSRCSTSLVVASLLVTISLPAGLSYQRKAGMFVLSPRRIPAWLAEV